MTYTTYPYAVKADGVYYPPNTPVPVADEAVDTAAPAVAAEKAVVEEPAKEETKPVADEAVDTAAPAVAAEKAATKSANKRKGRKTKSAD